MYSFKSVPYGAAPCCARVKSYVDIGTLRSVMQTVTEPEQGRDKKGCRGIWIEKGGRGTQRQEESNGGRCLCLWLQRIN